MIEKLLSDRIQKTTSRLVLIGLAAASMMITVSMIGAIQLQEASAAKPTGWYYDSADGTRNFYAGEEGNRCRHDQKSDQGSTHCIAIR